jgi:hypothetical protein
LNAVLLASPSSLVEVSYRPDLRIMVVRWLGVTSDDETRQVYQHLVQVAEHDCRHWLIDARRRPSSGTAVTQWIFEEFAPRASQQLKGPLYLSYLIAPSHLAAAEDFQRGTGASIGSLLPYRLHYASQEDEATQWLLQAQQTEGGGLVYTATDPAPAIS